MKLTRRSMLKLGGIAATTAVAGAARPAAAARRTARTPAVLVDTTRCIGCRACEAACAEANALDGPARAGDPEVLDVRRSTDERTFTVVNRVARRPERFVKSQCMHCLEPGCASACPTRALEKTAAGPVVYNPERCLGCRYCMVACPFNVPKYEYTSASPYVRKCTFCAERQARGIPPACTSVCPSGALTFGARDELLEEARRRIYSGSAPYIPHIYGEHEAGGTSWLYISDLDLDALGLPSGIPNAPYASLASGALSIVPFVLTLWPPLLLGLSAFTQRRGAADDARDEEGRHA
jgi:Fe-S-cluster-containing dehydrogenase component